MKTIPNLSELTDTQVRKLFFKEIQSLHLSYDSQDKEILREWLRDIPRTLLNAFYNSDSHLVETGYISDYLLGVNKELHVIIAIGYQKILLKRNLSTHPMDLLY